MRDTDLYKKMTPYMACGLAEGFEEGTYEDQLIAFQWIRDTKLWQHLQGFYGRTVHQLLEEGVIE
jgi:hypothetical protein